jgi:hypothetical protein
VRVFTFWREEKSYPYWDSNHGSITLSWPFSCVITYNKIYSLITGMFGSEKEPGYSGTIPDYGLDKLGSILDKDTALNLLPNEYWSLFIRK